MNQLRDLLKHELEDLYSAEEQILKALPDMIEKAKDQQLKKALKDHLKVTEVHKKRLDQVLAEMNKGREDEGKNNGQSGGFLSGLFGGGKETCKGMEGLIKEGTKVMGEDMEADVMDAAIIGAAQKIEHYEIASYGTVRAYAEELGLKNIEKILRTTRDEEYEADTLLNQLALNRLNLEAIEGGTQTKGSSKGNNSSKRSTNSSKSSGKKNQKTKSESKKGSSKTRTNKSKSGSKTKSRSRAKA
ncbi:MAG TPA: ferritin-like domain-containing protein [Chitinophagaceae bacterium]|nr:ferritin-like domain-containing protein [Chitinophagaceae bacterium]